MTRQPRFIYLYIICNISYQLTPLSVKLQDIVVSTREYLLGMSIELERRRIAKEDPSQIRRNLELAAYFTHCKMQTSHLNLALRNAMRTFAVAKCHASAAKFARRLIALKPDPKVVSQVSINS